MLKNIIPDSLLPDAEHIVETIDNRYKLIQKDILRVLIYPRIDDLPEELIDLLAQQFHIEGYDIAKSITEKRAFVKNAILLHRHKGTKWAIKKVLEIFGLDGEVKEWFETSGQPYTFSVSLSGEISDSVPIAKLINLINEYKNVRSKLARFDFTSIKALNMLFLDTQAVCDIEPESYFLAQKDTPYKIKYSSIFNADPGISRFYAACESQNIGVFSTNDLYFRFAPDIHIEPVFADLVPRSFATILEIYDEGSASVFREYFLEGHFLLNASFPLLTNAAVIINMEV